jgi:predicted metalloendopeptidase
MSIEEKNVLEAAKRFVNVIDNINSDKITQNYVEKRFKAEKLLKVTVKNLIASERN